MSRTGRTARTLGLCAGLALTGAMSNFAQQQAPAAQPPEQVRTGTTSGMDTEQRLENLLADHQFPMLEKQLDQLPPEKAQMFRGILANRENDAAKSIGLLEPLLDTITASGNTTEEKLVRKTLAEDYLREGDMAKAAKAYQALDARLHSKMSNDEKDEIELPLKLLPLAAANPSMTVEPSEPFVMQVDKDPLGLTDVPVFVDALPHRWMLDPTAPFNLIARSTAREVGLKVSDQAVTIHSLTGRPMQVHMTVIPRITVGGRLTLRNMTAFVFEDGDYYFPRNRYQVQGVLAYPGLQALGSLTINDDSTIEVRPGKAADSGAAGKRGARFFLDGDQLILALGKPGDERMFVVDAGGQQSYFTSRFFAEHANDFSGQKMELFTIPGTKYPAQPAYAAETLPLQVGDTVLHVHYIEVLTQPVGEAALDDVYGVLGIDALEQLRKYTFDYRTMRFTVPPEDGQ